MLKEKNYWLLVSSILALCWLAFSAWCYFGVGALGISITSPYMIVAAFGTLFHLVGATFYKSTLTFTGIIVELISAILMPSWGFAYVLIALIGYVGYIKMK